MSSVVHFIRFAADHRFLLTGLNVGIALPAAVAFLVLRGKILRRERWVGFLGWAFLLLAFQYLILAGFAWAGATTDNLAEDWLVAILSSANNFFFLATARSLLRKERLVPWWAWALGILSVVGDRLPSGVAPDWISLHRVPDAVFSGVALGGVAFAIFSNLSPRRGWLLAGAALLNGTLYVMVSYLYALAPLAIGGGLGRSLQRELTDHFHLSRKSLDSSIFGLALPLKFFLACIACALIVRTIVILSPRTLGTTLRSVSKESLEFFTSLPSLLAQSTRADQVTICYRIPSLMVPQVAVWRWPSSLSPPGGDDGAPGTGGGTETGAAGPMTSPDVRRLPAEDSLEGFVLAKGKPRESLDIQRDRRNNKLPPRSPGAWGQASQEKGSLLVVPIFYNGFITGAISLGWDTRYAFSQTTRQQAETMAEMVSIVVEARRRLAVVLTWGEVLTRRPTRAHRAAGSILADAGAWAMAPGEELARLMPPRTSSTSDYAGLLFRILAPLAVGIYLDIGFEAIWAVAGDGKRFSQNTPGTGQPPVSASDRFAQAIALVAGPSFHEEPVQSFLSVAGVRIGTLAVAWPSADASPEQPVVLCDPQLRQTLAALLTGAILDAADLRMSALLSRLQSDLSAPGVATPRDWLAAIEPTIQRAGLAWVVALPLRSREPLGHPTEAEAIRLLLTAGPEPATSGEPEVIVLPEPAGGARNVVRVALPTSGATLWLGVKRAAFRPELRPAWPWGRFIRRLGEVADIALARISSREEAARLHSDSERFKDLLSSSASSALLLHEITNIAAGFRAAATALDAARQQSQLAASPGVFEKIQLMQVSVESLFAWIDKVKQSWATQRSCRLLEAINEVVALVGPDLRQHRIEIFLDVPPDLDPVVAVPFHVAHLAVLSLVRNSIDAIGDRGSIRVVARQEGSFLCCDIVDSGHGVAPQIASAIFEGHSTKANGHGRGLPSIRRLLHGKGRVLLSESRPFERTVFTIELPIPQEERSLAL